MSSPQHFDDLEEDRITGFSNIEKEPQRCKEAKLHDAQTSRAVSHLEHLLRKMQDYRALKPALTQITF